MTNKKRLAWPLAAGFLIAPAWAYQDVAGQPAEAAQAAQDELDDLIEQYDDEYSEWQGKARKATTREEYNAIPRVDVDKYATAIRAIIERSPGTDLAARGASWIVTKASGSDHRTWALEVLLKDHIKSEVMGDVCMAMRGDLSLPTEKAMRAVISDSPHAKCQTQAKFQLAQMMSTLHEVATDESMARRYEARMDDDRKAWLASADADAIEKEMVALLEDVAATGGDIIFYGKVTIGSSAAGTLFERNNLQIGMEAPDIEGEDIDGTMFKLSDYRGKVVMLDFWGHW